MVIATFTVPFLYWKLETVPKRLLHLVVCHTTKQICLKRLQPSGIVFLDFGDAATWEMTMFVLAPCYLW